jgi:hypothetical protein
MSCGLWCATPAALVLYHAFDHNPKAGITAVPSIVQQHPLVPVHSICGWAYDSSTKTLWEFIWGIPHGSRPSISCLDHMPPFHANVLVRPRDLRPLPPGGALPFPTGGLSGPAPGAAVSCPPPIFIPCCRCSWLCWWHKNRARRLISQATPTPRASSRPSSRCTRPRSGRSGIRSSPAASRSALLASRAGKRSCTCREEKSTGIQ